MSFYPASCAQNYKFTFSTRCRCSVWTNFHRVDARCADREVNIETLPTVLNAFRIEGSCDAPETTKFSTGLQQGVYVAIGYNIRSFACTPLYARLMLLAPSYPCPRKKFKLSLSCDKFVNMQSARASPVVEVSRKKHRNSSWMLFWQNGEIS